MLVTESPPQSPGAPSPDPLRVAFHELHGRSLHGFALLLTLGDRATAATLTSDALAEAGSRLDTLRHPERAAAWLRARVLRMAAPPRRRPISAPPSLPVLAELGADEPIVAGLAALDPHERAAFIASSIERLDQRDVAVVVGRDGSRLERFLARARRRYLVAYQRADPTATADGPIADQVDEAARRAIG